MKSAIQTLGATLRAGRAIGVVDRGKTGKLRNVGAFARRLGAGECSGGGRSQITSSCGKYDPVSPKRPAARGKRGMMATYVWAMETARFLTKNTALARCISASRATCRGPDR